MARTILPDARLTPRFAGFCTFCRYPRLQDVGPDGTPIDWLVYGVPFDAGVTYRPGARFGPRAIRDESQYVKRFHVEHGIDLCERLSIADAGDAPVSPYDVADNARKVHEFARGLIPPSARLFAVGGDHSIAYSNIRATHDRLARGAAPLALLHFDSHLDTVDAVWGSKWGHASPFRRAIEDGLIDPKRMLSVGIKGPLNSADDLAFARSHGIRVLTHAQCALHGAQRIREFVHELHGSPLYITFDIDVVDPAFAPGTGTPSVGGLTSAEALGLLRASAGAQIVGADVVEVLPDRDPTGITALLAAHVMFEILALSAVVTPARA